MNINQSIMTEKFERSEIWAMFISAGAPLLRAEPMRRKDFTASLRGTETDAQECLRDLPCLVSLLKLELVFKYTVQCPQRVYSFSHIKFSKFRLQPQNNRLSDI